MSIDDSDADAVSRTEVFLSWTLRSWTCGWPISSHIHYKIYISGRAVIPTWRRLNAKPTNKSTNYRRSGLTTSQRRTRQHGRTLDICWPDFIFDDNRRSFRPQMMANEKRISYFLALTSRITNLNYSFILMRWNWSSPVDFRPCSSCEQNSNFELAITFGKTCQVRTSVDQGSC